MPLISSRSQKYDARSEFYCGKSCELAENGKRTSGIHSELNSTVRPKALNKKIFVHFCLVDET